MQMNKWLVLAGLLILCLGVGAVGGWITAPAVVEWYPTLNKPSFNPPNWVFGPVWTALYIMMAIAAWLVWQQGNAKAALTLFFAQLALNSAWSFLFFGARSTWLGLVGIAMLWLALLATVIAFFQKSKTAGFIMLPYMAWVSFAAALNFAFWQLN